VRKFLAVFSAFLLALGSGSAFAQAPIKLVYATYVPKSLTLAKSADWFMDEVTRRTNGRVVFERYYAQAMMAAPDLFPGLSRGALDISLGSPSGYNPKDYPYSNIVMPYTTDKVDAIAYALNELYVANADYRREFESKGIQLLWHTPNIENTLWTNKKVTTRADLQGMRLRTNGAISVAYETLGATPVALSPVDALEAFKRGAIDGLTTWPMDAAVSMGVDKVAKYVGDSGKMGIYGGLIVAMNKQKLESLPPDVRKVFLDVASEATAKYIEMVDADVQAAADSLAKNPNVTLVELSADEAKAWKAATQSKMRDTWIQRAPDKKVATEMLDQFTAIVRKHEAGSTYLTGVERYKKLRPAGR
jgi:TRAP-type C4-dicarboxylate transport system substrate-binding protein